VPRLVRDDDGVKEHMHLRAGGEFGGGLVGTRRCPLGGIKVKIGSQHRPAVTHGDSGAWVSPTYEKGAPFLERLQVAADLSAQDDVATNGVCDMMDELLAEMMK
jgi:hypothetical protein